MARTKDIDELRRALRGERIDGVFYATVESVDEDLRTCSVTVDDLTYNDVALYAIEGSEGKGSYFIPTPGSIVLVGRIGSSNELYVAMHSQVDSLSFTIGDKLTINIADLKLSLQVGETKLIAADDGLIVERGSSGLKKTLADLCDAISKLTVPTPEGTSGVPINMADFIAIKQALNSYLK